MDGEEYVINWVKNYRLEVRFNRDIIGSKNKGRRKVREFLFIVISGIVY